METFAFGGKAEELYRFLMVAQRLPLSSLKVLAEKISAECGGNIRFVDIIGVVDTGRQWTPTGFWLCCGDWYVEKLAGCCGDVSLKDDAVNTEVAVINELATWALNDPVDLQSIMQRTGGELKHRHQFRKLPNWARQKAA